MNEKKGKLQMIKYHAIQIEKKGYNNFLIINSKYIQNTFSTIQVFLRKQ